MALLDGKTIDKQGSGARVVVAVLPDGRVIGMTLTGQLDVIEVHRGWRVVNPQEITGAGAATTD